MRAKVVFPDTDYDYGEDDQIIDETRLEEEHENDVYLGEI